VSRNVGGSTWINIIVWLSASLTGYRSVGPVSHWPLVSSRLLTRTAHNGLQTYLTQIDVLVGFLSLGAASVPHLSLYLVGKRLAFLQSLTQTKEFHMSYEYEFHMNFIFICLLIS